MVTAVQPAALTTAAYRWQMSILQAGTFWYFRYRKLGQVDWYNIGSLPPIPSEEFPTAIVATFSESRCVLQTSARICLLYEYAYAFLVCFKFPSSSELFTFGSGERVRLGMTVLHNINE